MKIEKEDLEKMGFTIKEYPIQKIDGKFFEEWVGTFEKPSSDLEIATKWSFHAYKIMNDGKKI